MAKSEHSRSNQPLFWLAGFLFLIAAVLLVRTLTRSEVRVRVARATFETLKSTVPTNGKVEPAHYFQAHAPTAGVIQRIYVVEGQQVSAGTLLVKMDDAEARARLASARATLAQAELQLSDLQHGGTTDERTSFGANLNTARLEQDAATRNLALVESLQKKGSASAAEVGAAQQRVRTADLAVSNASARSTTGSRFGSLDLASARARLEDARASMQAAQDAITAANIRSPYSGTVYYIPVSQYDFVPAGEDLMDVADLNKVQVRAYFDEPEIGKLANGQSVKITWDAKPNAVWHGHIEHAPGTVIQYGTRNVGECLITVDDARGDLLPNTNVIVTVTEAERSNVLSVPREALHTDGARNYVYRIVEGKLQQAPVQVGPLVTLTKVEITGGLHAGDTVVLGPATPGTELVSGLPVKPVA